MGKTIVEKIISNHAYTDASAGDLVIVDTDFIMIHDINGPKTVECFYELGVPLKLNPRNIVLVLDHFAPCPTASAADLHGKLRKFALEAGTVLYEPGEGICHQLVVEKGHILPGMLATGTDSHAVTYGALNAIGLAVGAAEAAVIMASRQCWLKVPESVRVNLSGQLQPFVSAKDISLQLIGMLTEQGAMYQCIEFGGEALRNISVDGRMVLCNMTAEAGAKTATMPGDQMLVRWLLDRGVNGIALVEPDADAQYRRTIDIDVSTIRPKVSCHPNIDHVVDAAELAEKKVDQVIIGSCTNGRMEDFRDAAAILRGKKIRSGVRLIIIPASRSILEQLIETNMLYVFVKAGAMIYPPGCGPCAGLHGGLAGEGEIVLSTTNRNMRGRMGSSKAEIYISSPSVAACSALTGKITVPLEGELLL
jgi:homoaconitate hydratase family protein